uniref:Uncharacterized protein n=1 Tax=Candidatus Kentrum sp. DK TaxID=2126562 RepID=A0A450T8T6_9GAMM|nr:MAG: hypothetical protein BECKDK2373C_GA0170839_110314 [Candidatus Kentron sp. DK]
MRAALPLYVGMSFIRWGDAAQQEHFTIRGVRNPLQDRSYGAKNSLGCDISSLKCDVLSFKYDVLSLK